MRDRVVDVLKSQSQDPDTQSLVDSVLTIAKSSRPFSLHILRTDGEYSQDTHEVVGPKADGVCIRVKHVTKQPPERTYRWEGPYWYIREENYILAGGKGFLVVEIMYGKEFPREVVNQISQCFGDSVP